MENSVPEKIYDERSRLWYEVRWDDEVKRYVWHIAPHQQLIEETAPKQQER